jgi:hypothetical protein
MRRMLASLIALCACGAVPAVDFERSQAKVDVYGAAMSTFGISLDTGDSGFENEAFLNLRLPFLDVATRNSQDQGDFYGWIELRNLSFRIRQDDMTGNTLPGNTPISLDYLTGQFGGSVSDWLDNKPFVFTGKLVYNPYPYTTKFGLVLYSAVAQTNGKPEAGYGLDFNKAEAVSTPLFKTWEKVKNLGDLLYDGMDNGGLILSYESRTTKVNLKAFSHNDSPLTSRIPAWKDGIPSKYAFGVDYRFDFLKDFIFIDASAAYDMAIPDKLNAGFVTAYTFVLNWGSFAGFQLKPSLDLRADLRYLPWAFNPVYTDAAIDFDARLDLIALLSDADKNDQATMLIGSMFYGDDQDIEYALIFLEPMAGGWLEDAELGCMFSAMDILGKNPQPLPEIRSGPSAQYSANLGFQLSPQNALKAEFLFQTGLAAYFASAAEEGLSAASAEDRCIIRVKFESMKLIPNTNIIATWQSGDLLTMARPLGYLTVQTKVEF